MMVRFSKLTLDEQGKAVETHIRHIKQSMMMKCPHYIMLVEHYREDDTCRCNDKKHKEMKQWGYKWNGSMWV
jgi:hypothetical protein